MALPAVAVVILNYNGRKHLENFLASVIGSTYANLRVIVADNASTDGSVDFVQTHFPSVEIITHPVNEGFAGGYNWALKKIQSDSIIMEIKESLDSGSILQERLSIEDEHIHFD